MKPAVVLVAAALALSVACRRDTAPDIVLVTLDTTRADRLGLMGDASARTPSLDGLAARGVVFERAYASAPLTLPSHTSILTGLDPDQHGVHDNGRFTLPAAVPTVTERLAARGYDTAAFVAAIVLDSSYGLARGFATYDDDITPGHDPLRFEVPRREGAAVTDRALAWLGARGRKPFFLWVHYYDVHLPRQPPAPFDAIPDDYAGALAYVDAQVGRLLDGVARAAGERPTLIVVVGDHGESLGEHGEETHGVLAYDATLHVPLVVAGPGFASGRQWQGFVRTIDVAPTILAAAGAAEITSSRGRPLQARDATSGDEDAIGYFESFGPSYRMGWARLGGVRTPRWKLTAEPAPVELYDTIADPFETVNRAAAEPAVVAGLQARWDAFRPRDAGGRFTPAAERRLAALGYVDAPRAFPPGREPDPRTSVAAVALVDAARNLALQGRVAASIQALELLASSPVAHPLALASLAPLYLQSDRPADALGIAQTLAAMGDGLPARLLLVEALSASGRDEDALRALDVGDDGAAGLVAATRFERGEILLRLGRASEAASEAAAVLEANPWDDLALALASRARGATGGTGEERPKLERLLASAPSDVRLVRTRAVLAELQRDEGRDVDAVRTLEADGAPPPEYRVMLGEIAAAHGNPERAASLYASAIADRPSEQRWRRRLAEIDARLGRLDAARTEYDRMLEVDPANPALLVERGATQAKLGHPGEAERDYLDAIGLAEPPPEAFLNLALLELSSGRERDAETHLLRALELRPGYRKAHFHLARLYTRRGDPRANAHAEEVVGSSTVDGAGEQPDNLP